MDLRDMLDRLDRAGAHLGSGAGGLHLTAPRTVRTDPEVRDTIRSNRGLLLASIAAGHTGHVIGFCDRCGAASLVHFNPRGKPPRCRITPGCDGRHHPRVRDVQRMRDTGAPAQPAQTRPAARPARKRFLGPFAAWPTPPRRPRSTAPGAVAPESHRTPATDRDEASTRGRDEPRIPCNRNGVAP